MVLAIRQDHQRSGLARTITEAVIAELQFYGVQSVSMIDMDTAPYDLWFDANSVAGNMVAECWISHGPRAGDADFDPAPGDWLTVVTATKHRFGRRDPERAPPRPL